MVEYKGKQQLLTTHTLTRLPKHWCNTQMQGVWNAKYFEIYLITVFQHQKSSVCYASCLQLFTLNLLKLINYPGFLFPRTFQLLENQRKNSGNFQEARKLCKCVINTENPLIK